MPPMKVEQYEDFVLKLKIKAADGTSQIRRVRLPRIADAAGNVSYEELVGLVVTFTFPADSTSAVDFDCTLTYFDEDEDAVTIASTAELVDAVEQFVDKKVLRISTEVKRKTSAKASTPQTIQTPESSSGTTDRGTSTQPESLEANLQNVLESFASVVVTAVTSLEKELTANSATSTTGVRVSTASSEDKPKAPEEASKPAAKPSTAAQPVESQKPEAMVKPFVHCRHTCDSCLMNPIVGARYHAVNMIDFDMCEKCYPNYSGTETEFISYPTGNKIFRMKSTDEEKTRLPSVSDSHQLPGPPNQKASAPEPAPESAPRNEPDPSPTEDSLPFIHGRHTCDSCLMNPIIGKRYHAANLKDYDLCEKCYPNYQGTEIQLEEAELSRDRAFQKRWNRRRERIEKMNRKRPGRRCHGRRSPETPRPEPTCEPSPAAVPTPPPSAPVQESTARVIPIQQSASASSPVDDVDGALKEAIRRSLEDVMPKEIQDFFEPSEPVITPSAPTEDEIFTTCGATEIVNGHVTSTSEPESEVVENVAISDEGSRASSSLVEVDEQRLLDSMVEDNRSVDSEDMMGDDDFDMKPAAVDRETSMSTPERKPATSGQPNTPGTTTDDSFALDAVGNGDIAEAIGATLDSFAGVIDAMLTETDAHNNVTAVLDEVIASNAEQNEPEVQPEADVAEEPATTTSGALIVGADEATEDPREEVDGWQVVDENKAIANATQMLGSALFNSDLRSSEIMDSNNSGVLSAASSVPSDLPSVSVAISDVTEGSGVADAQRNRWASQLFMMREMGFDDEGKCIDTLERLQAANIGCGEEDEVSVTQAVEAMLSELK